MNFRSSKFVKYGFPFFLIVIGGSFGLQQFTELKYKYGSRKRKELIRECEAYGHTVEKPKSLETVYEEMDKIDTTNWENKRGPRPWEESNELFQEAILRSKEKNNKT